MKLLYAALWRSMDGTYQISNTLYETDEAARKDMGADIFVRLLKEWPPVSVAEVFQPKAPGAPAKKIEETTRNNKKQQNDDPLLPFMKPR